jgi:peroxiredoxin Q/BCP
MLNRTFPSFLAALIVVVLALAGSFAVLASDAAPGVNPMPQVGQKGPGFTLPDQDGKTRHLKNYRGHVLLLAFYPADFTSGCTIEAHTMTAAYKDFLAAGITPIGVSVQDVKSHKAFCEKEGIPYTLLADSQKKVAAEYGVLTSKYGGVANRVTFIIGKKGHVVYVDPDVNSHLQTCAEDWIAWVKAHQALVDTQ